MSYSTKYSLVKKTATETSPTIIYTITSNRNFKKKIFQGRLILTKFCYFSGLMKHMEIIVNANIPIYLLWNCRASLDRLLGSNNMECQYRFALNQLCFPAHVQYQSHLQQNTYIHYPYILNTTPN